jgi:hypothetical protein
MCVGEDVAHCLPQRSVVDISELLHEMVTPRNVFLVMPHLRPAGQTSIASRYLRALLERRREQSTYLRLGTGGSASCSDSICYSHPSPKYFVGATVIIITSKLVFAAMPALYKDTTTCIAKAQRLFIMNAVRRYKQLIRFNTLTSLFYCDKKICADQAMAVTIDC